eukprot:3894279-Alexandrium_andersonii.AAC.1
MTTSFRRPHANRSVLPRVIGWLFLAHSCRSISLALRTRALFWRSACRRQGSRHACLRYSTSSASHGRS